jgi:hypothetical protein
VRARKRSLGKLARNRTPTVKISADVAADEQAAELAAELAELVEIAELVELC